MVHIDLTDNRRIVGLGFGPEGFRALRAKLAKEMPDVVSEGG